MSHQAADSHPISVDSPGDPTIYPDGSAASTPATSTANAVSDQSASIPPTAQEAAGEPPIALILLLALDYTVGGVPLSLNMDPTMGGDPLLIRAVLNAQIAGAAYRLDPTRENKKVLMDGTKTMFRRARELKYKVLREEGFPWYGARYYCLVWLGTWELMDILWIGALLVLLSVLIIKIYEKFTSSGGANVST